MSENALRSNLLATAAASSSANTNGVMGTGISATYFGVADAWAGVGLSYQHAGSKLKNRIAGKLLEMALDPLPPEPNDISQPTLTGPSIPVAHKLSVDVQLPDESEWTSIFEALFYLKWDTAEQFWDLFVDDPTGQFSKSDFTKTTQMVFF